MYFLLILFGAILGSAQGPAGFVLGAVVGYLFKALTDLKKTSANSQQEILKLKSLILDLKNPAGNVNLSASEFVQRKVDQSGVTDPVLPVVKAPISASPDSTISSKPQPVSREFNLGGIVAAEAKSQISKNSLELQSSNMSSQEPVRFDANKSIAPSGLVELYEKYLGRFNPIVIVGVLVLFFGVAFVLQYAVAHRYLVIPIQLKLLGISFSALLLFAWGWKVRDAKPAFSMALQGGSAGILYITVLAAHRLYHLLPLIPTFVLLVVIVFCAGLFSFWGSSQILATLSVAGGFLAPFLVTKNFHNHQMLFSYFILLNAGIFCLAWFKSWATLNMVGFCFTALFSFVWGQKYYRPEHFLSTEVFLLIFFVVYLLVPLVFHLRNKANSVRQSLLVWALPVAVLGFQTPILKSTQYGMGYAALLLGLTYLLTAIYLKFQKQNRLSWFVENYSCIGLIFLTIACPNFFSAQSSSAIWAITGVGLSWNSLRSNSKWQGIFSAMLQFAAGIIFITEPSAPGRSQLLLNSQCFGMLVLSLCGFFSAYFSFKQAAPSAEHKASRGNELYLWGLAWWFANAYFEIYHFVSPELRAYSFFSFFIASAFIAELLGKKLTWPEFNAPALILLPAGASFILWQSFDTWHLGAHANNGWLVWTAFFVCQCWILHHEQIEKIFWRHCVAFWSFVYVGVWEISWLARSITGREGDCYFISMPFVAGLAISAVLYLQRKVNWPVDKLRQDYLKLACAPLVVYIGACLFLSLSMPGEQTKLYLPLVNRLDLGLVLLFSVLLAWIRGLEEKAALEVEELVFTVLYSAWSALAFLSLNAFVARAVHHWFNIPYTLNSLLHRAELQSSISVVWAVTALSLVLIATRKKLRQLWLIGAILITCTVAKLFLIDLSNTDSLARIISFIGVGLLLLIVGYFAPIPPAKSYEK